MKWREVKNVVGLGRMGVSLVMVGLRTHLQALTSNLSVVIPSVYPHVGSRGFVTLLL